MITEGDLAWAPDHVVRLSPDQRAAAGPLLDALAAQPLAPPPARELPALVPEILTALVQEGDPVMLSDDLVIAQARIHGNA